MTSQKFPPVKGGQSILGCPLLEYFVPSFLAVYVSTNSGLKVLREEREGTDLFGIGEE